MGEEPLFVASKDASEFIAGRMWTLSNKDTNKLALTAEDFWHAE